jgi:uncharacterized membrane protein
VAGLGAFLLVAAAATFVAVRWADIPEEAKLGALVAITAACLVVHRRLRQTLPVTAAALFHLGVFLVPIDVAAIGVWGRWGWPTMLLAQGLAGTLCFAAAAHTERSVVLRWGTWAGVVLLAGGIGATTALPAGLVLAAIALAVATARRRIPASVLDVTNADLGRSLDLGASAWAVLAGLAVPLADAERLGWPAAGVLADLGLTDQTPHPVAAVTGIVAGAALIVVARSRRNLFAALAGIACAIVGLTVAWIGLEPSGQASLVALAVACLLAEGAAGGFHDDPFWSLPTRVVAWVGEAIAVLFTLAHAFIVLVTPLAPLREPVAGLAAGLVAVSWVAAAARRQVGDAVLAPETASPFRVSGVRTNLWRAWGPVAATVSASAAIALTTGSSTATGVTVAAVAAAILVVPVLPPSFGPAARISSVPPTGRVLAAGLLGWAPLAAYEHPTVAATLAVLGALAVAESTVHFSRQVRPWSTVDAAFANTMVFIGLGPIVTGSIVVTARTNGAVAIVGAIAALWLIAAVLDRAEQLSVYSLFGGTVPQLPLATVPRAAVLVPLVFATGLPPTTAAAVGGFVAALALLDALRLDEPLLLVGVGCAMPVTLAALAVASDWSFAEAGVGVTLSGIAWLGLGGTLSERWVPPAVISAGVAGIVGVALSIEDATAFSTNLLLIGGTIALVGVMLRYSPLVAVGVALSTFGVWGQLGAADVRPSESYAAPVALLLLVAGMYSRREHGTNSWVAYSPPIFLLGGLALVERLVGGPAGHALLAGMVGFAAVAAGGAWRLGAPLILGTGLVVAVTIHETLGVTAGVPTWAWLAIGGSLLLGAGVAMERQGLGPYETGRRLVDVVRERFA